MGGKRLEPDLTPADKRVEHVNNVHIKRETRYRFRMKRKIGDDRKLFEFVANEFDSARGPIENLNPKISLSPKTQKSTCNISWMDESVR